MSQNSHQGSQNRHERDRSFSHASIRSLNSFGLALGSRKSRSRRRTSSFFSWRDDDSSDSDRPFQHNLSTNSQTARDAAWINQKRNRNSIISKNNESSVAIKIIRIVSSWKITYTRTERNPEQFLLILKDYLRTSGTYKYLFVFLFI